MINNKAWSTFTAVKNNQIVFIPIDSLPVYTGSKITESLKFMNSELEKVAPITVNNNPAFT